MILSKKFIFLVKKHKKIDFEKSFFVFYVKRSYLAFGGQKTAKDRVFGSTLGPRNKVFHVF